MSVHRYCSVHSCLSQETKLTFDLHRDILHVLLLPIRQICSEAAGYARRTLPWSRHSSPRPSCRTSVDLEVAFRGQARSAFSWLQCFIREECDWMAAKGCATCVVLRTLQDEPFIRLVVAACRVSSYLHDLLESRGEQLSLPDFSFWLDAIRCAVTEDAFWGIHFWYDIEARAMGLEAGIQELVTQCLSQPTPQEHKPGAQNRSVSAETSLVWRRGVANGSMVKRQRRLREEEERWLEKIVDAYWSAILTDAARRRRLMSLTKWQQQHAPCMARARSMTS
jgi:hypothetical protein